MWTRFPRLALALSLSFTVLTAPSLSQKVKSNYDKSADFASYKRYAWGSNYLLLARQPPQDKPRINGAIVDSINRNLQSKGFVLDPQSPQFLIYYEAGGSAKGDIGALPNITDAGYVDFNWGMVAGTSSDAWVYTLAKMHIVVKDSSTKQPVWQSVTSEKIRDVTKAMNNLKQEVDDFVSKALKDFPPKK
ncbi:MAG TPA: DUF4136 domain-containing protein [Candidatus Acidoferrales bacterium]|nr:DUF4136 domain-containing protein [Candidatus Acidoferrales bacterium]